MLTLISPWRENNPEPDYETSFRLEKYALLHLYIIHQHCSISLIKIRYCTSKWYLLYTFIYLFFNIEFIPQIHMSRCCLPQKDPVKWSNWHHSVRLPLFGTNCLKYGWYCFQCWDFYGVLLGLCGIILLLWPFLACWNSKYTRHWYISILTRGAEQLIIFRCLNSEKLSGYLSKKVEVPFSGERTENNGW